jgi:hypothetical protein
MGSGEGRRLVGAHARFGPLDAAGTGRERTGCYRFSFPLS